MCFAFEVLVLLEEGATSTLPTVLARKLAAEGPAQLCRLLKQYCTWLLAGDACTCIADVTVLQHVLRICIKTSAPKVLLRNCMTACIHSVLQAPRVTDDM